jgi:hypothetical protein
MGTKKKEKVAAPGSPTATCSNNTPALTKGGYKAYKRNGGRLSFKDLEMRAHSLGVVVLARKEWETHEELHKLREENKSEGSVSGVQAV